MLPYKSLGSILEPIASFIGFLFRLMFLWLEAWFRYFIPLPLKSLHGQVILITGSANGIGRQICLQLASLGATLVCWDIHRDKNEELVEILKSLGTKAFGFTLDIADKDQVRIIAAQVKREVGHVTMVINNAGIMTCNKFLALTNQDLDNTFRINVLAHFWILCEFLPTMLERNEGHIVGLASACALVPADNLGVYCASKAAVVAFMDSLRQELRSLAKFPNPNVHVTTVYPVGCKTDMISELVCTSRYPGVQAPLVTPELVAEKLIDGVRRNCENVYVPGSLRFVDYLMRWMPSKVLTEVMKFSGFGLHPPTRQNILDD